MNNSYWNGNGKNQAAYKLLWRAIPPSGPIVDKQAKALERFRVAANCYYDLYNNGLCNRAAEFRLAFGFSARGFLNRFTRRFDNDLYILVEEKIDALIEAALVERRQQFEALLAPVGIQSGCFALKGETQYANEHINWLWDQFNPEKDQ